MMHVLKDGHEGDIDLMPEDERLKEKLNTVLTETKKERKHLFKYYEKKLNEYSLLQGTIKLSVRYEGFYKGTKPNQHQTEISFRLDQHYISGCPPLILKTLHGGRWIWYKINNKYEVQKYNHLEHQKRNI